MKEFPGWRLLKPSEILEIGDTAIWNRPDSSKLYPEYAKIIHPDNGKPVGISHIGTKVSNWMMYWAVYRRIGPRKLKLNPHFSKPLPLP